MRKILFALMILPVCGYSQTNYRESGDTSCFKRTKDKFTDEVSLTFPSQVKLDLNTSFTIYLKDNDKYKYFSVLIQCSKIRTVNEKSYVIIIFEDGSKETINNSGGYDLSGGFTLFWHDKKMMGTNDTEIIRKLTTLRIQSIRLSGYSTNHDIDLSEKNSGNLRDAINCVYTAWRP